jgi:hypothetical protein
MLSGLTFDIEKHTCCKCNMNIFRSIIIMDTNYSLHNLYYSRINEIIKDMMDSKETFNIQTHGLDRLIVYKKIINNIEFSLLFLGMEIINKQTYDKFAILSGYDIKNLYIGNCEDKHRMFQKSIHKFYKDLEYIVFKDNIKFSVEYKNFVLSEMSSIYIH